MTKIAILGANGQVGSEVALMLSAAGGLTVVGLTRSEYGAALLRLAGVPCANFDYEDIESLSRTLSDCDVVVDFTYPSGQVTDIRAAISRNVCAVMRSMRPTSRYLHMSSISAFGMPPDGLRVRNYIVPRTGYAVIKRWAEREVIRLGRIHGVETFVYRLGQVHGVLQSVTHHYCEQVRLGTLCMVGAETALSTTVFTNEVAEAVLRCAEGAVRPASVYTLVSNPQWTLGQLGDFYRRMFFSDLRLLFESHKKQPPIWTKAFELASSPNLRQFFEAHVFLRFPEVYTRAKGRFRIRSIAHAISRASEHERTQALPCIVGSVPGPIVPAIHCSLEGTLMAQRAIGDRLEQILSLARAN